jgi:hypothetical protein
MKDETDCGVYGFVGKTNITPTGQGACAVLGNFRQSGAYALVYDNTQCGPNPSWCRNRTKSKRI